MKNSLLLIAILSLSGCFFLSPIGDVWFIFEGIITDTNGKPVPGVEIKVYINNEITSNKSVTITDDSGKYQIHEDSCPCDFNFKITATKSGYNPWTHELSSDEAKDLKKLNIKLMSAKST